MSTKTDPGSAIVEIPVIYIHATDRGVAVRETEDDGRTIWFPLSQVEVAAPDAVGGALRRGSTAILTAPRWLLEKGGLL